MNKRQDLTNSVLGSNHREFEEIENKEVDTQTGYLEERLLLLERLEKGCRACRLGSWIGKCRSRTRCCLGCGGPH